MRTLKFLINNNTLAQDPAASFDGLFPAPNQEIRAEFHCTEDWANTNIPKVAAFYSMLGKEYPPQIIDEGNRCMIPPEALTLPAFKLQILGNIRGKIMTTNILTVYQKGGKA
jgi:hypothetical protein